MNDNRDGVLSSFIKELIDNGLLDIADIAFEKGDEFVKSKIKEQLNIDLDNGITPDIVETIKMKEDDILDILIERNRHDEKLLEIDLKELGIRR